jgi:outer membrane protein TolC
LGPDTLSPQPDYPDPGRGDRAGQRSGEPQTRNPAAKDLRFSPADEARDVNARLQAFVRASIGEIQPEGDPDAEFAVFDEPGALRLSLEDALRAAQRGAREYLTREEDYILAAIRLLTEQHRWGPRLFNDTSFTFSGQGDDGDFEHTLRIVNTLRATQRLPSGGEVEARWIFNATEQLRSQVTDRYQQSGRLVLDANMPLLRGAGASAREDLIQAQRDLIYAARDFERFRREFLVSIANDYFRLIQLQNQIRNQLRQLRSLRLLEESTRARVEAGRLPEFERNIASNRLLSAQASLASLAEQYVLATDRFKVRLGMPPDMRVVILPIRFEVPEPEVSLEEASAAALEYRLDLQNQRDRIEDARRRLNNRRNQLLPDLNLRGGVGVPTDRDDPGAGLDFEFEDLDYNAALTLSLPLDRRIERLSLKSAVVQLQQALRGYDLARDNAVIDVRSAVRNIELARFRLRLAERQVEINRRRLEEQRLKIDQVDLQRIVDSENDLLDSENQRDQARTDLRNAVLNYLLRSDQLRVARDGTFLPLPGMSTPESSHKSAPSVPPGG